MAPSVVGQAFQPDIDVRLESLTCQIEEEAVQ
jgi:hypothetical protein